MTSLPGIGPVFGRLLREAGFTKAEAVLGQFLVLGRDEKTFKTWLKGLCTTMNAKHQNECYEALKQWCEQHV